MNFVAFYKFFDYLQQIYDTHEGLTLVIHNGLQFDDIFLRKTARYLQKEKDLAKYDDMFKQVVYVDLLMVARYLRPERRYGNHNMRDLCQLYNVQNRSFYETMGDVNALFILWKYFTDALKQKHSDIFWKTFTVYFIL